VKSLHWPSDRVCGLLANVSIYPHPPVRPILKINNVIYSHRRDGFIAKQAAAEQATTAKDEALEELIEAIKTDIRYAGNTVNFNDEKLKLIGWAVLHF
jgi:hypothetical protein